MKSVFLALIVALIAGLSYVWFNPVSNVVLIILLCTAAFYFHNRFRRERGRREALSDALALIRQQLEGLIEASASIIYSRKPDAGNLITFVSENVSKIFGYEPEEFIKDQDLWIKRIHDVDREHVVDMFQNLFEGGIVVVEYRFFCKDGTLKWVQDKQKVLRSSDGTPIVIIGNWIDVTERVITEDALVESEQRFRDMFEQNSAAMLIVSSNDTTVTDANYQAQKYFGYTRGEMIGRSLRELAIISSSVFLKEVQSTGRNHFIVESQLKNGDVRDVELHVTAVSSRDELLLFIILHDVTEKVRYEQELIDKTEELDNLNKDLFRRVEEEVDRRKSQEQLLIHQSRLASMGEMIGAITHQWRQPLNTLSLIVQDIREAFSFGQLDHSYIDQFTSESMEQIGFMSHTIEDFRNFFRPSRSMEMFDVRQSVVAVVKLLTSQFSAFAISVNVSASGTTLVPGYDNEFKQAVLNLLNNSKDAILDQCAKGDKEHCNKLINVNICEESDYVILEISDTGGGIPGCQMAKLFTPYFTTKEKGTGIGLYMCKLIIEDNMNGKIIVNNTDKGALFTIKLRKSIAYGLS